MDKLETLKLYTRIVELGSFSQAANQMGIPHATASNAIKSLEQNLQSRLLERTTRHVRPSLDGQAYYDRCKKILADLDEAESSLKNTILNPHGKLRIDLPTIQANLIVLPRIDEFHARYPNIELIIGSGERLVDLVKEGIDCVIRSGTLEDSSLICKKIADIPQVICASPEYLKKYGTPLHLDDLVNHYSVGFFSPTNGNKYPIEIEKNSLAETYLLKSWVSVNNAESYVLCALKGAGLIQVPVYHIAQKLKDGQLVEVLPQCKSTSMSVSIQC
jgi:DNA-binding transcriptional LysR family regulator